MMLAKDEANTFRLKSFSEFYIAYISEPDFQFWFILLENLFTDLSNFEKNKNLETQVELKNDIRPLRIIAIQYWCRILMKKISKELDLDEHNVETRPADKVLENLSCDLTETIKSYKLKTWDIFASGIKFK